MLFDALESSALVSYGAGAAAEAFNASYEGYIVPLTMTLDRFERRFRAEDVDPFASRIWHRRGQPAGVVLISRRGCCSRVAALGVAEPYRRQGLGRSILEQAIGEARTRGDTHMWLEVFEANQRARALYRSAGFVDHSRLLGFLMDEAPAPTADRAAAEVSIQRGVEIGARNFAGGGLPWMLEAATLAAATDPVRCFVDANGVIAAFVDPQPAEVRLVGMLGALSADSAPSFMRALRALYPSCPWKALPIFPEEYATLFFEPSGWHLSGLPQSRMVYAFANDG